MRDGYEDGIGADGEQRTLAEWCFGRVAEELGTRGRSFDRRFAFLVADRRDAVLGWYWANRVLGKQVVQGVSSIEAVSTVVAEGGVMRALVPLLPAGSFATYWWGAHLRLFPGATWKTGLAISALLLLLPVNRAVFSEADRRLERAQLAIIAGIAGLVVYGVWLALDTSNLRWGILLLAMVPLGLLVIGARAWRGEASRVAR